MKGLWSLPPNWRWAEFGEVAHVDSNLVDPAGFAQFPHIAPNHIESGTGRLLEYTTVATDGVTSGKHLFRAGHILYSKIRPYLAKVVVVDFAGLCSADMYPISTNLETGFLHWWLVSPMFTQQAAHNQGRTILPKINQDALAHLPVPVAPRNEQRRIVAKLEALQARSRCAREALDAVPPLLEKLRQSILAAAFRGDLTKDWRAKHKDVEPASKLLERIRAERRKKWEEGELAKMKAKGKGPKGDEWKARYKEPEAVDATGLPELPEGWCWASLDELAVVVGGITKGQQRNGTETLRHVPYLRVANVQRGHLSLDEVKTIEATEQEVRELRLFSGDVLLNEGGDRDKLGRGWVWEGQLPECIHQNHVFRARLVAADLQPRYVSHYANQVGQTFFVDQGKQTTNLASVSLSRVRRLPVALPSAYEQAFMIQLLDERLAQASRLEVALKGAIEQLEALDKSTLARAFRGELVPQDMNDEPAEVMLARVRTQTGAASNGTNNSPSTRPAVKRARTLREEEA